MFSRFKKFLFSGVFIIAFFTVLSKITGLINLMLLSSRFAISDVADAYLASFRIPDFIFNTLVLGALSVAFIPVFLEYYYRSNKTQSPDTPEDAEPDFSQESELGLESTNLGFIGEVTGFFRRTRDKIFSNKQGTILDSQKQEHWLIANSIFNFLFLSLALFCLILFFLTPYLIPKLVSGFDPTKQSLTITYTRIILFSTIIFGISNVIGGILQSFRKFLLFALAPVLYNVGKILGILLLVPIFGSSGLAWGVILGAILHLLIQVPGVIKAGFRWQPVLQIFHPGVKKIVKLVLPRTVGLAATQINQVINTYLASHLAAGSVAVFYYAYDLQSIPVSVFGVSFAVAAYPVISKFFVQGEEKEFIQKVQKTAGRILFLVLPVSLFMILMRAQIIRLILGTGIFDWRATILTLQTFAAFAVSLFAQCLLPLLSRVFFARHNTKTPVIIGILSVGVNIIAAFIFSKIFGIWGIALAFSLASIFNLALLLIKLQFKLRIRKLINKQIINQVLTFILLSIIAGWVVYGMLNLMAQMVGTSTYAGVLLQAGLSGIVGAGVYLGLAKVIKV